MTRQEAIDIAVRRCLNATGSSVRLWWISVGEIDYAIASKVCCYGRTELSIHGERLPLQVVERIREEYRASLKEAIAKSPVP